MPHEAKTGASAVVRFKPLPYSELRADQRRVKPKTPGELSSAQPVAGVSHIDQAVEP